MNLQTLESNFDLQQALLQTEAKLYLLMDGARFENIHAFIYQTEENPNYIPLYRNTYFETALEVSPCLVQLKNTHSQLLSWYIAEGALANKVLLITSTVELEELAEHFKKSLEAKLPSNEIVLFRFYDPVVFNAMAHLHAEPHMVLMLKPCDSLYWYADGVYKKLKR